jgi:hypothetical protein
MAKKNLLTRNNRYDKVRLVIVGSQSGVENYYYTEANGDRYYFNQLSSTASADMEAATFNSFLSFTMSGATQYTFNLVPMLPGETVMIETKAVGINQNGSKAYMMSSFGGFRQWGLTLSVVGSTINYTTKTDFGPAGVSFSAAGTQSVRMNVFGQTAETIDWNIHIRYTKGFHSLSYAGATSTPPLKPIYPEPPAI